MTVPTSTTNTKGGAALGGGQGAGVGLALAAGAQQAIVKALGVGAGLELLGFQHKVAAPVAVDAPGAGAAVAVAEGDRALEHVVLLGRGVRLGDGQQLAQFDDEALRGGQLAGGGAGPAGDEGFGGGGVNRGERRQGHARDDSGARGQSLNGSPTVGGLTTQFATFRDWGSGMPGSEHEFRCAKS